jgi:hypothetical protein
MALRAVRFRTTISHVLKSALKSGSDEDDRFVVGIGLLKSEFCASTGHQNKACSNDYVRGLADFK